MDIEWMILFEVIWDILMQLDKISNLGLLILAGLGLNSWYKEYKYKKRSELAEEILCLFYQMQEAISWVRHPAALDYEIDKIKKQVKVTLKEKEVPYYYLVAKLRMQEKKELIASFSTLKYIAKAKLNKKLVPLFEAIIHIVNKISIYSLQLYSRPDISLAECRKRESVIWEGSSLDGKDEISAQIVETIEKVEKICEKYIK